MSSIQPISNLFPAGASPVISNARPAGQAGGAEFGDLLRGALDKVSQDHQTAQSAVGDLITGQSDDVLPVVTAAAKADLSFKLLIGVRNKVIEAYRQTMNMQV